MEIILLLIFAHFLCDFPLQGEFLSQFKARLVNNVYNPMWYWCLTAHSSIHSLAVLVITKSIPAAILMLISHFIIDFLKCEKRISFNTDQFLHLGIILIIGITMMDPAAISGFKLYENLGSLTLGVLIGAILIFGGMAVADRIKQFIKYKPK